MPSAPPASTRAVSTVAVAAIVLKPLLDQRGKLVELRSAHRRCASVEHRFARGRVAGNRGCRWRADEG